ncbi:allophanate hydrolase subunit 1 [Aestuariibacter halophilus]|uniref:Allophanate hydrolase subunit 1 n=1 Tax=Fluctibacter halophilus TaxID=226011 RepID=A0ABS8G469_9ALTE|nr:allophanate hydrolase subunit 1 [Aestuariibacter halophilus]MCC2615365.1 allophanate hydrolase subunit 1 [Aestuariibacter halophilus]
MTVKIVTAGVDGVIVYAAVDGLEQAHQQVCGWQHTLEQAAPAWLQDSVVSYRSLYLQYDVQRVDHLFVRHWLMQHCVGTETTPAANAPPPKVHTLPVCYSLPDDHDRARIAEHHGISEQQVIDRHCQQEYRVYALGFAPGFAFLGEVEPGLAMPRLPTPRQRVPAGAVAIADRQTAIYPTQSPGGWNIIGRCPVTLFNAGRNPPALLRVGDTVRFKAITADDFERLWSERGNHD